MHPPYPSETRAKGWRFELDPERIRQSDTWALATPELRPWLLMLWMVAWEQTPCGSLPSDDGMICARIGMPPKLYAKHRATLLRGWEQATDGRLYHPTITERVLKMLASRAKDRLRTARSRSESDRVTRDTTVTHPVATDESQRSAPVSSVSSTPVPVPEEEQDQKTPPTPPTGGKRAQLTFTAWIKSVPAGTDAIPPDHHVFAYADRIGISREFLDLAWMAFERRYAATKKRYTDWPRVFRNAVEGNWAKLWFLRPDGGYDLTTVGRQLQLDVRREAA